MKNSHLATFCSRNWQICALEPEFYLQVVTLANQVHGSGYLTLDSLSAMVEQGRLAGQNSSYVAVIARNVVAYRLSFAAGRWQPDK